MYNSNLAIAVKVGGKVLREDNGKVLLPFGTEYTIYLKNTSMERCKATILVDGKNILGESSIIIPANDSIEVSRFMVDGNTSEGNSLKFIEKTEKISEHRGDRIEDGLVTVQYEFESQYARILRSATITTTNPRRIPSNGYGHPDSTQWWQGGNEYRPTSYEMMSNPTTLYAKGPAALNATVANYSAPVGITAPGSHNTQKFTTASWHGGDGMKYSMTLCLYGKIEERESYRIDVGELPPNATADLLSAVVKGIKEAQLVTSVVTTREKIECTMCGTKHKSSAKFCSECGTSLKIY
jgi:hypothetical protein